MIKVMFLGENGESEIKEMGCAPSIGHKVATSRGERLDVIGVLWFPCNSFPHMEGVDLLVTID